MPSVNAQYWFDQCLYILAKTLVVDRWMGGDDDDVGANACAGAQICVRVRERDIKLM